MESFVRLLSRKHTMRQNFPMPDKMIPGIVNNVERFFSLFFFLLFLSEFIFMTKAISNSYANDCCQLSKFL